jgi:shikimate kinase
LGKTNIVLTGFMYAGKTTVGELLATLTGKQFVDTDALIERDAGKKVTEIFAEDGESGFRRLERQAVDDAAAARDQVIALGGGAVIDPTNVEHLKASGVIYYLEIDADEVARRAVEASGRPLLEGKDPTETSRLLQSREEYYMRAADVTMEAVGREPADLADEIARDFNSRSTDGEGEAIHG